MLNKCNIVLDEDSKTKNQLNLNFKLDAKL